MHGVSVAEELAIPVVIVPPNPGVTSALGCLLVDIQHDFSDSYMADASTTVPKDLEMSFRRIEEEAAKRLKHEGVSSENTILERSVEMMYQGQWRSLSVSAPSEITDMNVLIENFHSEHEREYNFRRDDAPVSIFRVAVKATGLVQKADLPNYKVSEHTPEPTSSRSVWFNNISYETNVFERSILKAGAKLSGPAIIEQVDSTVLIPPNSTGTIDKYLNIIIKVNGG